MLGVRINCPDPIMPDIAEWEYRRRIVGVCRFISWWNPTRKFEDIREMPRSNSICNPVQESNNACPVQKYGWARLGVAFNLAVPRPSKYHLAIISNILSILELVPRPLFHYKISVSPQCWKRSSHTYLSLLSLPTYNQIREEESVDNAIGFITTTLCHPICCMIATITP